MIYLGLSISVSALVFIIFRGFNKFSINNSQAIVVNYFIASGLGFLISDFKFSEWQQFNWLPISAIAGTLFISLFMIMAVVSQKQGVSVAAVAVKMSVVIPVAAGVFIYKDSFGVQKVFAITLSLVSILLVTHKQNNYLSAKALLLPTVLFFGNGILDMLLKYSQAQLVPANQIILFTSFSFATAGLWGIISFPIINKNQKLKLKNIVAGVILGIPNFGTIYFLLKALENAKMESSIFFPINNIGIVILSTLLAILIFKERLTVNNWIGISLGAFSILLIGLV